MLVRFKNEIVNINNVIEFYHYNDFSFNNPYMIKFVSCNGHSIIFSFGIESERNDSFNMIFTCFKCGDAFCNID